MNLRNTLLAALAIFLFSGLLAPAVYSHSGPHHDGLQYVHFPCHTNTHTQDYYCKRPPPNMENDRHGNSIQVPAPQAVACSWDGVGHKFVSGGWTTTDCNSHGSQRGYAGSPDTQPKPLKTEVQYRTVDAGGNTAYETYWSTILPEDIGLGSCPNPNYEQPYICKKAARVPEMGEYSLLTDNEYSIIPKADLTTYQQVMTDLTTVEFGPFDADGLDQDYFFEQLALQGEGNYGTVTIHFKEWLKSHYGSRHDRKIRAMFLTYDIVSVIGSKLGVTRNIADTIDNGYVGTGSSYGSADAWRLYFLDNWGLDGVLPTDPSNVVFSFSFNPE